MTDAGTAGTGIGIGTTTSVLGGGSAEVEIGTAAVGATERPFQAKLLAATYPQAAAGSVTKIKKGFDRGLVDRRGQARAANRAARLVSASFAPVG
jgi:hypothetical protein